MNSLSTDRGAWGERAPVLDRDPMMGVTTLNEGGTLRIMASSAAIAGVLAAACAGPTVESNSTGGQTQEERVLAAEDAYVAAEVNRDEAALRRLVDDRFVHNSGDGSTSTKEDLIRAVLNMNMTGQTISERSVLLEGDVVAIIFGTTELRFEDPGAEPHSSKLRYTSVYAQRDGEWRMLALQMQPHTGG